MTDGGHNLSSDASCKFTGEGSLNSTNPRLAPLANNGGFTNGLVTRTMALQTNSPAIDAGDDNFCPPTDQRGIARPQGMHCDIGAFEFNGSSTITNETGPTFAIGGRILDGTNGLGGVVVTAGGRSATSDSQGNYSIVGLTNDTYLVAPSPVGAGFTPTNQTVLLAGADVVDVNFTANAPVARAIVAPPAPNPAGPFSLQFVGLPQKTFNIETSTNLADWIVFTNGVTDSNGIFSTTASNSALFPQQFFRSR